VETIFFAGQIQLEGRISLWKADGRSAKRTIDFIPEFMAQKQSVLRIP
jgi:hypothetical protein